MENDLSQDLFHCDTCQSRSKIVLKDGIVCTTCGVVSDCGSMFLSNGTSLHVIDCIFGDTGSEKKTYKHVFYWNERMAQFRMEEPPICSEHQEALCRSYYDMCRSNQLHGGNTFLTKYEVKRVILHARLTTNKYLEKYLSIGYMLTGIMPYESKPSFELINSMTRDFTVMIKLFFHNQRFGRHAMINYNLIIRETLKRNGGEEYVRLFPELKTKNKLNRAMQIYEAMWFQMIEASLISAINQELRFKKLEDAKADKKEIAPRITRRSHLKRKYVDYSGSSYSKRHRKIPRRR